MEGTRQEHGAVRNPAEAIATAARLNWELVLIVCETLLGAGLRLFEVGAQSLWLDELFSVAVSRRDLAQVIAGTALGDTNPPLFNLLLHIALQLGSDEVAARAVSVIFSTACIPVFYLLAKRLFGSVRIAAIAAMLLAVSPFQIAYAQEARMYALLAFLQLLAIFFFHHAWTEGRGRYWVSFGLAETLAFYTHSLAGLNLLALDAFAVWHWREFRTRWRALAAVHVMVAVLFAPWAIVLAQQGERVMQGFWNPSSTVLNLLRSVFLLNFGSAMATAFVPVGLTVTLLLFALGVYAAVRALIRERILARERESLQLALAVMFVPPIALLALSVIRPLYIERVLISSAFGLFLIWGWAWTKRSRWPDRIAVLVGGLLLIVALTRYYAEPSSQKPPMREAAQVLASHLQAGDLVLHTSDWSALAFAYYSPNIPQHFLSGDPDYLTRTTRGQSGIVAGLVPEDAAPLIQGHPEFWLIVAVEHSEAYQQGRVQQFDRLYRRESTIDVNGIYLLSYRSQ